LPGVAVHLGEVGAHLVQRLAAGLGILPAPIGSVGQVALQPLELPVAAAGFALGPGVGGRLRAQPSAFVALGLVAGARPGRGRLAQRLGQAVALPGGHLAGLLAQLLRGLLAGLLLGLAHGLGQGPGLLLPLQRLGRRAQHLLARPAVLGRVGRVLGQPGQAVQRLGAIDLSLGHPVEQPLQLARQPRQLDVLGRGRLRGRGAGRGPLGLEQAGVDPLALARRRRRHHRRPPGPTRRPPGSDHRNGRQHRGGAQPARSPPGHRPADDLAPARRPRGVLDGGLDHRGDLGGLVHQRQGGQGAVAVAAVVTGHCLVHRPRAAVQGDPPDEASQQPR
jgi:hypothetical protein